MLSTLKDSFKELRTKSIAKVKKIREHFGVSRIFCTFADSLAL